MPQSPDRADDVTPSQTSPVRPPPSLHAASIQLWSAIEETIQEQTNTGPGKPRMSAINVPLYGASLAPPEIGWVASIGIDFNARIVGYQIFALVLGQMSIDIQKSDIVTHPSATFDLQPFQFPSIVGDPTIYPSINGAYADSFDGVTDITLWAFRDLFVGDMLHFYIMVTDGLPRMVTLMLYLQDLDERT